MDERSAEHMRNGQWPTPGKWIVSTMVAAGGTLLLLSVSQDSVVVDIIVTVGLISLVTAIILFYWRRAG
jgi:hypothetical protein